MGTPRLHLRLHSLGPHPSEEPDIHAALSAGLENGTLRPVVAKELPLAEAARAHKEIVEPGAAGKIVLIT
ncbi:MAG: zinc-binding dehydrogenase [Candidatus Acidiferrales bacterium]